MRKTTVDMLEKEIKELLEKIERATSDVTIAFFWGKINEKIILSGGALNIENYTE